MKSWLLLLLPCLGPWPWSGTVLAAPLPMPVPDPELLRSCFSGGERLRFDVSWSGGIKIGELDIRVEAREDGTDGNGVPDEAAGSRVPVLTIRARVRDWGMFKFFYPVDDLFVTEVSGPLRLPRAYRVLQREGQGRVTRRFTRYDQQGGRVFYRKNDQPEENFPIDGPVHNEFSSFFFTRTIPMEPGAGFNVPTFADRKRHQVPVDVLERESLDSLFGPATVTLKVAPRMPFKGLYGKRGATIIWLTDDACRAPVRIRSEIVVGSLTADLVEYANPACGR